jgi:hypothetical protein
MKLLFHLIFIWAKRIFYGMIALLIIVGGYFFVHPSMLRGNSIFANSLYETVVAHSPEWLLVVDYLIFLFLVTSLVILFLIVVYIKRENKSKIIEKQYFDKIIPLFFSYIYQDNAYVKGSQDDLIKTFQKLIKDERSKKLFLTLISQVHAMTVGEVKDKTALLLRIMPCRDWLYRNLHSLVLVRQLFALKVIAEFHLTEYSKDMRWLLKKKNYILRYEAYATLLKLHVNETLLLFTGLQGALNLWEMNMIIKIALDSGEQELEYALLIRQDMPELAAIGIILARLNRKKDLKSAILTKLDVDSQLVRDEAVLACLDFAQSFSDYILLIDHFEKVSEKVQKRILRSMISCPDQSFAIHFLKKIVETNPVPLKIVALISLLDLDLNVVQSYENHSDASIRQSFLQVVSFY